MEKSEVRKLSSETQYELHKQVESLNQIGRAGREISEVTGLSQAKSAVFGVVFEMEVQARSDSRYVAVVQASNVF